jgi:hypothetical protein
LPAEEFNELFAIGKKLSKEPFCDISSQVNSLRKNNSLELQNLLQVYVDVYERQQAAYLSKLYSRMRLATLKGYIGNADVQQYLNKYSWKLSGDVVTTSEVCQVVDAFDYKEEIELENELTVYFENITKANSLLKLKAEQTTK